MKTPFALFEGRFYVTIKASGIHPLIPYIDGMAIAMFSGCKKAYIRLDDAIEWHEKELEQSHGASGNKKALELLKQASERLSSNTEPKAASGDSAK